MAQKHNAIRMLVVVCTNKESPSALAVVINRYYIWYYIWYINSSSPERKLLRCCMQCVLVDVGRCQKSVFKVRRWRVFEFNKLTFGRHSSLLPWPFHAYRLDDLVFSVQYAGQIRHLAIEYPTPLSVPGSLEDRLHSCRKVRIRVTFSLLRR